MAKRNKSKLEMLLAWNKRPFVDKMLDDGDSPNKVHKWITDNGLELSVPTVYTYAKKRKEAIMNGVKFEIIKEKKGSSGSATKQNAQKKSGGAKKEKDDTQTQEDKKQLNRTVKRVMSELEILDAVIDKGFSTLQQMEVISPDMALKAIKLKHEITGGEHQGITMYGIEQIRLREAARENAMMTIMLEFVPEEKHDELLDKMEKATREYYAQLGLEEAYQMEIERDSEEDEGDVGNIS